MKPIMLTVALAAVAAPAAAQNRIDGQAADAPALSAYGDFDIGVRRLDVVNPDQVDILAIDPDAPPPATLPRYDRPLAVEMWYPAQDGATGDTTLDAFIRDGATEVELQGRAVRDAAPAAAGEPFPLVVVSHGYPGNRFLLSHLAENIASKGYVVASIDHTDSTYRDQAAFGSTLVNRPLDQLHVLDEVARINADLSSDLAGLIDTDNAGLVGYSMGGYGAVITAGGGVTQGAVDAPFGAPHGTLGVHLAGSDTHEALPDDRFKTAVAFAPWGRQIDVWDAEGLAGVDIPMLFVGGSADAVSGYEEGFRRIWEEVVGVDRALLTFEGGGHNTAAPIPAPEEAFAAGVADHYVDPVWDTVFMNNVAQHFVTAWLDGILKGDADAAAFLDLPVDGAGGWTGFADGAADGLRYETLAAGQVAPVPVPGSAWLLGLALGGMAVARRRRS